MNNFNHENARRLVADLEGLISSGRAAGFDHMHGYTAKEWPLGCVACRVKVLQRSVIVRLFMRDRVVTPVYSCAIERFLGCTDVEARYLWVPGPNAGRGVAGVRNAVARIREVISHYPEPAPASPFIADESKFLADLKATIGQPIPVDEQA